MVSANPLRALAAALIYLALSAAPAAAQVPGLSLFLDSRMLSSTDSFAPTWLTGNRGGAVQDEKLQGQAGFSLRYRRQLTPFLGTFAGLSASGSASEEPTAFLREGYAGLSGGPFLLHGGWLPFGVGELPNSELSTGSMAVSNNALPIPRVTFRTADFVPVPWTDNSVRTKFGMSHGWFLEERHVENPILHEKWAYLELHEENVFSVYGGLVHFAMWGGDAPDGREFSVSFEHFLDILFARMPDENAAETDLKNRGGDHFGMWDAGFEVNLDWIEVGGYYHHYFEDGSGFRFINGRDGLWGLSLKRESALPLVPEALVVERIRTDYQSGPFHDIGGQTLYGRDSYYSNGVYRSGWTHYGRIVGTALFLPSGEGEDTRIGSNRIEAWHTGVSGALNDVWGYRLFFTSVAHRPNADYTTSEGALITGTSKWQYDSLVEVSVDEPFGVEPLDGSVGAAVSYGELEEFSLGFILSLRWQLLGENR